MRKQQVEDDEEIDKESQQKLEKTMDSAEEEYYKAWNAYISNERVSVRLCFIFISFL